MNNFWTRATTGGVFTATLVVSAVFSKYLTALLFAFFAFIGMLEYLKMVNKKEGVEVHRTGSILLGLLTYILIILLCFFDLPVTVLTALIPIVILLFVSEIFRLKAVGFVNIAHALMPSIYIAIPFALFVVGNEILQQNEEYSAHYTLFFYFTLWSNDTGAYLAGRSFGKHKLFPAISPNKTWEGTIGGALAALLIANICASFYPELSRFWWSVLAMLIVVFGSLGDLLESMLKRNFGVKDSGRIMPGHGGILDRFDSLIIAAPVLYTCLVFLKHFGVL